MTLADQLKKAFATNFQYYSKAHGFHVNVTGADFTEDHILFQKIYEDAQEHIDEYAEHIRALDEMPDFSLQGIMDTGELAEQSSVPSAIKMVGELLADTETLIGVLADCYDMAGAEREYGLQNFIADRMDTHAKYRWQLTATLG
jgi:starvation-inducible DNA-binding protein